MGEIIAAIFSGKDLEQAAVRVVPGNLRHFVERFGIDEIAQRIPQQPCVEVEVFQRTSSTVFASFSGELAEKFRWATNRFGQRRRTRKQQRAHERLDGLCNLFLWSTRRQSSCL